MRIFSLDFLGKSQRYIETKMGEIPYYWKTIRNSAQIKILAVERCVNK
jgi:hypothetical protein